MKPTDVSAAALITEHRDELLRFVRPMVGPDRAEDVAQEAFFRFSSALERGQVRNPRSYLFRIAANLARDELRRERRRAEEDLDAPLEQATAGSQPSAAEDAALQEQLDMLREAVQGLPRKCRRIFVARKYEGHTYREIAQMENISEKTVENHISRAIKLIREQLNRKLS
ncbi:MAG: RNA polymerase sigma factor [Xanthomonadales bacterium]|nr:RNA polymerase sigma factor [Xanthomonadales bacterium]